MRNNLSAKNKIAERRNKKLEKSRLWVRTFTEGNGSLVETLRICGCALVYVDVPFLPAAYPYGNAVTWRHHSSPDIHTSRDVWRWAIYAGYHAGTMTILN